MPRSDLITDSLWCLIIEVKYFGAIFEKRCWSYNNDDRVTSVQLDFEGKLKYLQISELESIVSTSKLSCILMRRKRMHKVHIILSEWVSDWVCDSFSYVLHIISWKPWWKNLTKYIFLSCFVSPNTAALDWLQLTNNNGSPIQPFHRFPRAQEEGSYEPPHTNHHT